MPAHPAPRDEVPEPVDDRGSGAAVENESERTARARDGDAEPGAVELAAPRAKRKKGPTAAQTMGGIIFGFEQQVWRTAPPPQELVEHARPDKPVAAPDGSFLTIVMPDALAIDDDKETR